MGCGTDICENPNVFVVLQFELPFSKSYVLVLDGTKMKFDLSSQIS